MNPNAIDTTDRPFVLIWELTRACELACRHCRAEANPGRHPDELTTQEGRRLLSEAARFGDGQLVVLSGGDPMARADVPELVSYGTDLGLRMTITPSGTDSLDPGSLEALNSAGIRRVALSLDGAEPTTHDAFRGEAGSFESTIRAARQARGLDIPLQINTTVCAATVDELPAIRDVVADLGAVLWSVFFLVPVGRGRVLQSVAPDQAERVLEWLTEIAADAPFAVKTTEAPQYRRIVAQRQHGSTPNRRAGVIAGDGFAFVSHTGEVYPSGFLPRSVGNVRETSVVELYRDSPLFQQLRDRSELQGKCGSCEFRHLCGGSRSRAFAATGDPLGSDPLCPYVPDEFDGEMPATNSVSYPG